MEKNTIGLEFACLKATLSFYFPSGETIDLSGIIVQSPHRPYRRRHPHLVSLGTPCLHLQKLG